MAILIQLSIYDFDMMGQEHVLQVLDVWLWSLCDNMNNTAFLVMSLDNVRWEFPTFSNCHPATTTARADGIVLFPSISLSYYLRKPYLLYLRSGLILVSA